jgi:hypothetical protein
MKMNPDVNDGMHVYIDEDDYLDFDGPEDDEEDWEYEWDSESDED